MYKSFNECSIQTLANYINIPAERLTLTEMDQRYVVICRLMCGGMQYRCSEIDNGEWKVNRLKAMNARRHCTATSINT